MLPMEVGLAMRLLPLANLGSREAGAADEGALEDTAGTSVATSFSGLDNSGFLNVCATSEAGAVDTPVSAALSSSLLGSDVCVTGEASVLRTGEPREAVVLDIASAF